jgi:two-component system cell cycle sensor histidine kinase/response regulator CckA
MKTIPADTFLTPAPQTNMDGSVKAAATIPDRTAAGNSDCIVGESDRFYQILVEEMPLMICRFAVDGKLTFANTSFRNTFNLTPDNVSNANFFTMIPDGDREAILMHYRLLTPSSPTSTFEYHRTESDGSISWQRWKSRAIFDIFSNNCGCQAIGEDISRIKDSEQERQLLEEQLQQAQKMEAIGLLAGGIAHDFNNILGGIIGYAELLQIKLGNTPESQYAERILNSSGKASALVKQLLTFARRAPIEMVACDVHERIEQAISLLGPIADRKIDIKMQFDATDSVVRGDRNELESALLNIAINARDAMPQGGTLKFETLNVTIDTNHLAQMPLWIRPGAYIQVIIADSGEGMSEPVVQHIFEPFFSTKKTGKGTGLGLASAYGSLKQHKGYIAVKSAVGKGTTFTILIPLQSHQIPAANNQPVKPVEKV